jgi:hypothetical protein
VVEGLDTPSQGLVGKDAVAVMVAAGVTEYSSPALALSGACPAPEDSADAGVPWHYGDPHAEQRRLLEGVGAVDLSHRAVIHVAGPDRLSWLHTITTQHLSDLPAGQSTTALVLSPHGHVEQELHLVDDGEASWLIVEAAAVPALLAYLQSMRFMLRVEVTDVTGDWAVVGEPALPGAAPELAWGSPSQFADPAGADDVTMGYVPHRPASWAVRETLVPRPELSVRLAANGPPAGTWAWEANRVAAAAPRLGYETDHRTIPHEVGWVPAAVHLQKGCYRGQETVARVHNLGRPPRRLVLLHLDGSDDRDPVSGDAVELEGRAVGRVTSVARHHELGPIALAVVKRSVPADATLTAGGVAAAQEIVVAP